MKPLLQADVAISSESDDKFAIHTSYARTLLKICAECPTPFVVGLFGRWGTGKSGVINLLKKALEDQPSAFRFVHIDVWKFTHEPLRRSILFEIESQLGTSDPKFKPFVLDKKPLRALLDYSYHWDETSKKFDKTFLWSLFLAGITLVALALGLVWGLNLLGISLFAMNALLGLAWGAVVSAGLWSVLASAVGWLIKNRKSTIFVEEVTKYSSQPTYSADQFSKLFKAMVELATTSTKRLIICFDNLDRCDEKTALETLSVIKTFLDATGTVYVIPCDEEGLVNHIISGLSNRIDDPEIKTLIAAGISQIPQSDSEPQVVREQAIAREFLRKFFQASIRIPPLLSDDIELYLDDVLQDAHLKLPEDAKQVILAAFEGKTPRQIKRFVNDLISYIWLAAELESRHLVATGELTDDVARLAKLVVLYSEWPEIVEEWSRDPYLWSELSERLKQNPTLTGGYSARLIRFLRATLWIEIPDDLTAVLHLKRASFETDPSLRQKVRAALSNYDTSAFVELASKYDRDAVTRVAQDAVENLIEHAIFALSWNALRVLINSTSAFGEASVFDDEIEKLFRSLLLPNLSPDESHVRQVQPVLGPLLELMDRLPPPKRYPLGNWIVNAFNRLSSTIEMWEPLAILASKPTVLSLDQRHKIGNILGGTLQPSNPQEAAVRIVRRLAESQRLEFFATSALAKSLLSRVNFGTDGHLERDAYLQVKTAASAETKDALGTIFRNGAHREGSPEFRASVEFLRKLGPADLSNMKMQEFTNVITAVLDSHLQLEEVRLWLPLFAQLIEEKPSGFEQIGNKIQQKIIALGQQKSLLLQENLDDKSIGILKSSPYTKALFGL